MGVLTKLCLCIHLYFPPKKPWLFTQDTVPCPYLIVEVKADKVLKLTRGYELFSCIKNKQLLAFKEGDAS